MYEHNQFHYRYVTAYHIGGEQKDIKHCFLCIEATAKALRDLPTLKSHKSDIKF